MPISTILISASHQTIALSSRSFISPTISNETSLFVLSLVPFLSVSPNFLHPYISPIIDIILFILSILNLLPEGTKDSIGVLQFNMKRNSSLIQLVYFTEWETKPVLLFCYFPSKGWIFLFAIDSHYIERQLHQMCDSDSENHHILDISYLREHYNVLQFTQRVYDHVHSFNLLKSASVLPRSENLS